jgi:DMSO/TMAO reductase YedYZ molybdopterin-dependent catalytic subunit
MVMQVFKRHKILVLISLLLIVGLVVSIVVYIQNVSPSSPPSTSPSPSPSSTPVISPSPFPSGTTPTPTPIGTPNPTTSPTVPLPSNPSPTAFNSPYLGEVNQYLGASLTPITTYVEYLNTHPDVAIAGIQSIDRTSYRLAITGMVNTPRNYTYNEVVNDFSSHLEVATLPCVEGWSVTMLWEGVRIMDILNQVGVPSGANTVIFLASDGYSSSLPLQYVADNNIMVAYKMNNVTLTPQLGFPLFLVATNQYGYKWVEWITEINVSNNADYLGYWESRGFPNNATVRSTSGSALSLDNPLVLPVISISIISLIVAVVVFYARRGKLKHQFLESSTDKPAFMKSKKLDVVDDESG